MSDDTTPQADPAERGFIWSDEHNAYWRPNGCGYTIRVSAVGIYSRAEFDRIASGCGPEKRLKFEPFPAHLTEVK